MYALEIQMKVHHQDNHLTWVTHHTLELKSVCPSWLCKSQSSLGGKVGAACKGGA